jgi:hypothetical protein
MAAVLALAATAWAQVPALELGPTPGGQTSPSLRGLQQAGDDCAGGEIYDDGEANNGYGGNPAIVSSVVFVQLFNPSAEQKIYVKACFNFASLAGDNLDFEIVAFANEGGQPGAELSATPVSISGIPGGLPGQWYAFEVTGIPGFSPTEPVFIGARWNPMLFPRRFVAADESPTTPLHPSFVDFNLGGWQPVQTAFSNYRALLIRLAPAPPIPTLSEVAFVVLAALLAVIALYSIHRFRGRPSLPA